jgi:hypothetical protein
MGWFNWLLGKSNKGVYQRVFQMYHPAHRKIREWQSREKVNWNDFMQEKNKDSLRTVKRIHSNLLQNFTQIPDLFQDYWQTSEESSKTMEGDCEDFAILLWSLLKRKGFDPNTIGMFIIPGHCLAFWQPWGMVDDFYVLDNGYYFRTVDKASNLFSFKKGDVDMKPILGFDSTKWWTYKEV